MEINIEDYIPLVKSLASKYSSDVVSYEDLYQEGFIGLLEASLRFDRTQNVEFGSYAKFWVKKRILSSLEKESKEQANTQKIYSEKKFDRNVPDTFSSTKNINIPESFPEKEKIVLELIFNQNYTLLEIAKKLNTTRERIRQIKEKALRRLRSYKKIDL